MGALIVVMVLFFIVSLTAAYTGRSMIFEQKTSANQYRSTQAFEAADAGIEWALAQLNTGSTTTSSCGASTTGEPSFRNRYLNVQSTGSISVKAPSAGGSINPICVFDGTNADSTQWKWSCTCPLNNAPSAGLPANPGGSGPAPAFKLTHFPVTGSSARPGVVLLRSDACTRLDASCLQGPGFAISSGDGVASILSMLALRSALMAPPDAALNAAGGIGPVPVTSTLYVTNTDATKNGLTIHGGSTVDRSNGPILSTLPGTPVDTSVITSDSSLAPAALPAAVAPSPTLPALSTGDRTFINVFGMLPKVYLEQPGTVQLTCPTTCSASDVNTRMQSNPGHPIWITGGGVLTIDANVGSVAAPALLILDGDITFSGTTTFVGFIYGRAANWTWTMGGTSSIQGAVFAEGALQFAGGGATTTLTYDFSTVLTLLRNTYGTFVRVPGGWKDFQ